MIKQYLRIERLDIEVLPISIANKVAAYFIPLCVLNYSTTPLEKSKNARPEQTSTLIDTRIVVDNVVVEALENKRYKCKTKNRTFIIIKLPFTQLS
jgi:hypothetical protein